MKLLLPLGLALIGLASRGPGADAVTDKRDMWAIQQVINEVTSRPGGGSPEWRGLIQRWYAEGSDPCIALANGTVIDAWDGVWCRYQDWLPPNVPRRITNFHNPKHGLGGNPPKSLGLLRMLVELDMDTNNFTGPIPKEYSCPSHLRELDLGTNPALTGTVPAELANLKYLEQLKLTNDVLLYGCLPSGLPPAADRVCSPSQGTCTRYMLEHSDTVRGTLNSGSGVSSYCDPSAYPPCQNDRALLGGIYKVQCPTNRVASGTASQSTGGSGRTSSALAPSPARPAASAPAAYPQPWWCALLGCAPQPAARTVTASAGPSDVDPFRSDALNGTPEQAAGPGASQAGPGTGAATQPSSGAFQCPQIPDDVVQSALADYPVRADGVTWPDVVERAIERWLEDLSPSRR